MKADDPDAEGALPEGGAANRRSSESTASDEGHVGLNAWSSANDSVPRTSAFGEASECALAPVAAAAAGARRFRKVADKKRGFAVHGSDVPLRRCCTLAVLACTTVVLAASAAAATEARVTVGSPLTPFPQNKQNEPAVAIDASRPTILASGSNDEIDLAPCGTTIFATDESPCPFTPGVGVSGIYF